MAEEEIVCSEFSPNKGKYFLSSRHWVFMEGNTRRKSYCPFGYLGIRTFLSFIRVGNGSNWWAAVRPLSLDVGPSHRTYMKEMWVLQRMEFPKWSCHRLQTDAFFLAPHFPFCLYKWDGKENQECKFSKAKMWFTPLMAGNQDQKFLYRMVPFLDCLV